MTTPLFGLGVGIIPVSAEAGATLKLQWATDVQKSISGKEQRVGTRAKPQQTYNVSVILDDAKGRAFSSKLARYLYQGATWRMAMPWEGSTVVSSTSTTITLSDASLLDWPVAGQPIVVEKPGGVIAETVIASVAGNVLTVDDNVSATAVANARVMPVMPVALRPTIQMGRSRVGATTVQLEALATRNKLGAGAMGTGATVNAYDGLNVWEWGVGVDGQVAQPAQGGGSLVDAGFVVGTMPSFTRNDYERAVRISSSDRIHWQYMKKFLDAQHGERIAFLLATGRPDLVFQGDASTGTLTVKSPPTADAPDYINDWYPSLAHRRLKLVKADGTTAYRKVLSTADNGGTQDLGLDSALAGALAQVEYLETVRFDNTQGVSISWSETKFTATLQAKVVQR